MTQRANISAVFFQRFAKVTLGSFLLWGFMVFQSVWAKLPELTTLIENNTDAVVHIGVAQKRSGGQTPFGIPESQLPPELRFFFRNMPQAPNENSTPQRSGMGSGFIVSQDGYVVTNTHVVDGADEITVTLHDKREFPAKVVGQDKFSDVALLKLDAKDLPTVNLGDSEKLKVGQWVVAIGAPFGLDYTATQGIVSALSRSLPDGTYVPFIQTDVAVNPGNSGGPLFDLDGNVVGVNSQIYSRSGGYMGISFAIPVNLVKQIVAQLKDTGVVSRGWLGVHIQGLDQALADSFGLESPTGALVAQVQSNSPAAKGGIRAGDVITRFNNKPVESVDRLPVLVGSTPVGSRVPVEVLRQGKQKKLSVTVARLDDGQAQIASAEPTASGGGGRFGVEVSELPVSHFSEERNYEHGVMLESVQSGSAAAHAGLRAGDILVSFNGRPVRNADDLRKHVNDAKAGKPIPVLIVRDGRTRFVATTLG